MAECSQLQLLNDSILNLELFSIVQGGERSVFEEMVRKTLDGGFYFGAQVASQRFDRALPASTAAVAASKPAGLITLPRTPERGGRPVQMQSPTRRLQRR